MRKPVVKLLKKITNVQECDACEGEYRFEDDNKNIFNRSG